MDSIDDDWESFLNNDDLSMSINSNIQYNNSINNDFDNNTDNSINNDSDNNTNNSIDNNTILNVEKTEIRCSDIYISTKTKIAYLNNEVDIYKLFWSIPTIKYYQPIEGIIKKQIKLTTLNEDDTNDINKRIDKESNFVKQHLISKVYKNKKVNYKYVQKVSIGLSKKDIISHRSKEKGAFYNCFALIFRILFNNVYKEVHIKVFNTGKLEIPGIQDNDLLLLTLNKLVDMINNITSDIKYECKYESIDTVLINSNFHCGYLINRNKLCKILKKKYNLICMFDSCSYPGIQCKFYYNDNNSQQDGICRCEKACNKSNNNIKKNMKTKSCKEISFMIFRTGSILIVGNCNEYILNYIYKFLCKILIEEYENINDGFCQPKKKQKQNKKYKKYKIIVTK